MWVTQGAAVSSPLKRWWVSVRRGDRHLRTPVGARNYPDVVRRNPGQFGFEEIGARSTFRAPDRSEIRSGTRSDGADFALAHTAKFWTHDAAVRAALSFQRMH